MGNSIIISHSMGNKTTQTGTELSVIFFIHKSTANLCFYVLMCVQLEFFGQIQRAWCDSPCCSTQHAKRPPEHVLWNSLQRTLRACVYLHLSHCAVTQPPKVRSAWANHCFAYFEVSLCCVNISALHRIKGKKRAWDIARMSKEKCKIQWVPNNNRKLAQPKSVIRLKTI